MCGITGYLTTRLEPEENLTHSVTRMCNSISHRGPDDTGVWQDASRGLVLGHRRLAIVDLSPQGHQPMVSASGRYVLVFNGEIYNHDDLRRELEDQLKKSGANLNSKGIQDQLKAAQNQYRTAMSRMADVNWMNGSTSSHRTSITLTANEGDERKMPAGLPTDTASFYFKYSFGRGFLKGLALNTSVVYSGVHDGREPAFRGLTCVDNT